MRRAVVPVLAVLFAGLAAQARTWTNLEGKTLEGDLVKVEYGQVYLRIARDNKVHPVKLETFSQADQELIRQFEKEQAERKKAGELANRKAEWLTEYEAVKAESEKFNYPVLLLFTAPEWCGYCVMLERNVLDREEFRQYANGHLVLFLADFSDSGAAGRWRSEYPGLAETFPVSGYPCAYLISTTGKKLGMIGGCDSSWTPKDYIERIEGYGK